MKPLRLATALAAIGLIIFGACCWRQPSAERLALDDSLADVLQSADRWTIHALNPSWPTGDIDTDTEGYFHRYEILGSAQLTSAEDRAALTLALNRGMSENDSMAAACFNPRHGIHAELGSGEVVDLVICFECLQVNVFDGTGEKVSGELTSASPTETFNQVYQAAGLTISVTRQGASR